MSVPPEASSQTPQQSTSSGQPANGPDPKFLLPVSVAGLGAIAYILAFFDTTTSSLFGGVGGFSIVATAVLAGMRVLPKAPNTLLAAAPFAAFTPLSLLQVIVGGNGSGVVIVLLILSLVQLAAVGTLLLVDAGFVEWAGNNKTGSSGGSAAFPRVGQQTQQVRPQSGGWNPQAGSVQAPSPMPSGQTGPVGPPQPFPAQAQPAQQAQFSHQPPNWNAPAAPSGQPTSAQQGQQAQPAQQTQFSNQPPSWNAPAGPTAQAGSVSEQAGSGLSGHNVQDPAVSQPRQSSAQNEPSEASQSGPKGTQQMQYPGTPPHGL